MPPKILVVIGASGVGKTATVRAIAARDLPGVSCFHFDSIGVPSPEVMAREFGGPESWQQDATQHWIARLAAVDDGTRTAVLDGQTRPSFVQAALRPVEDRKFNRLRHDRRGRFDQVIATYNVGSFVGSANGYVSLRG